tara:strand:- start:144 stop:881 length:738 start_codon:yes stop_codon:yes gene_type:complete
MDKVTDKPIVFQTWREKKFHKKIEKLRKKMIIENPKFRFELFSDEEMDNSIEEYFDKEINKIYFKLNHYAARSDFWRYLMLHRFGGVYLDIDSLILKDLSPIFFKNKSMLTLEPSKTDFIQWILMFRKDDKVLEKCIELIIENVSKNKFKNNIMALTGPTLFTNAIKLVLDLDRDLKEIDVSDKVTIEKLNSLNYFYFSNKQHDEYFLFKHKYNHLLRSRRKAIFRNYKPDLEHWSQYQKINSIY